MTEREIRAKVEDAFVREQNHTPHAYIDITGDLIAGTLLAQIMYWFAPSKDGKPRVRVFKDGYYWLAKKRDDWYTEIRISPKQYDRAIKLLADIGYVEVRLYKFDATPTTHIRPMYDIINSAVSDWKSKRAVQMIYDEDDKCDVDIAQTDIDDWEIPNLPKGENRNSPKWKIEIDQRGNSMDIPQRVNSITSTTTITTTSTTNNTSSADKTAESDYVGEFEQLWKLYPRKAGKKKAEAAYIKARKAKNGATFEQVKRGIENYIRQIEARGTAPEYIKHGSTWFGNECWNDEYECTPRSTSGRPQLDDSDTDNIFLKLLREEQQKKQGGNFT